MRAVAAAGRRVRARCDEWNRRHAWDHNAHHHGWLERHLPARAGTALDVGCGTGDLVRRLSRRAGHVTGLDVDPAVVATARDLSRGWDGVAFRCGDLLTADLPGGYDVVTAVAVLHHVPLEPALVRLRELLAPGGTLLVVGLYRGATPSDHLLSAVAVPTNLVVGAVRGSARPPVALSAPTAPATATLREVRDAAGRWTPGAVVRRHLFWRYSLRWRAPTRGGR
ncbi:class I SAM-dependent methyltransferase [Kineococcus sp. SYSU DK002]|uniref:class I SAM-dependent methyltransferase n=1 Tax=Kineococcus sp. SYSU DK002 TaxID=3383123 RepID=UPI003D7ED39E